MAISTVYISTVSEWQNAISDYPTGGVDFVLVDDLTFNSGSTFFLNDGSADSDYLQITDGYSLNGNSHYITFEDGCEPSGGISGVVKALGTITSVGPPITGSYATVENIMFYLSSSTLSIASNAAFLLRSSSNAVSCSNVIMYSLSPLPNNSSFFYYTSDTLSSHLVNFESVYLKVYPALSSPCCLFFQASSPYVDSQIYVTRSCALFQASSSDIYLLSGGTCTIAMNEVYVYQSDGTDSVPFYLIQTINVLDPIGSEIRRVYMISGDYTTTPSSTFYLIQSTDAVFGDTIRIEAVYCNTVLTTGTGAFPDTTDAAWTYSYTGWSSTTPSDLLSNSDWFTASSTVPNSPSLLSGFLSSPFDATPYLTFDSDVKFNDAQPCFDSRCWIEIIRPDSSFSTPAPERIPISQLTKGDLVETYRHGWKPVLRTYHDYFRNDPDRWARCMYRHHSTDVIVTGGHAMLVDALPEDYSMPIEEIDGKKGCMAAFSSDFVKDKSKDLRSFYHFCLEGDLHCKYGVWVYGSSDSSRGGLLMETCSSAYMMKCRGQRR